jgi:hypothetical protein
MGVIVNRISSFLLMQRRARVVEFLVNEGFLAFSWNFSFYILPAIENKTHNEREQLQLLKRLFANG